MARTPAKGNKHAIRRIFPRPNFWRPPPPGQLSSAVFSDPNNEPSIDLHDSVDEDECVKIRERNSEFIEKGFGLVSSEVSKIREVMLAKGHKGDVFNDPVEGNELHGVIAYGKLTDGKKKTLRNCFDANVCLHPDFEKYEQHLTQQQVDSD